MTAEEFDKKFDNGEDILSLMEHPKTMKLDEFKKEFLGKSITINFSDNVYEKIEEKANLLKVQMDDLIKIIVAEKMGVLK